MFSEKMAYYRTQHISRGVRITHMIGSPIILARMPLLAVRPRAGVPMFAGRWLRQIAGHRLFEHNLPSTHKGGITYRLTGMIHVCDQYGQLLARRSQRKAARDDTAKMLP